MVDSPSEPFINPACPNYGAKTLARRRGGAVSIGLRPRTAKLKEDRP